MEINYNFSQNVIYDLNSSNYYIYILWEQWVMYKYSLMLEKIKT